MPTHRELATRITSPFAETASVLRSRSIRRVVVGYAGFSVSEWATWIALLVYAYDRGGAIETGVVALVQLLPAAFLAPFAALAADRYPRARVVTASYAAQAGLAALVAAVLLLDGPAVAAYAGGAVLNAAISVTRPAQSALLPELARGPRELTAGNVSLGTVENLAILVGPALTGIALAATSAGVVFAATAILMVAVTMLLAGVPSHAPPGGRVTTSVVREVVGGFAKAVAPGPSRPIVAVLGAAVIVWGSLDVFLVVIAIDLLAIGEAGVGYLNSALGAGGVIGAAVAVGLVGRRRLAPALIAGTLAWGVGLAALGLSAELVGVLILLLLAGTGRVVMDVAGQTLLQRVTDHRVLARVFGVVEGLRMASMALGSILAPLLIGLLGTTNAILVAGLLPIATALIGARALLRADAAAVVPVENIALLRSNPIFVPLAAPAIELLARRLEPVAYATGSTVITQGEVGDHYYLIESGVAGIVADGRHVTDLRAGDGFGEIALLRDVPRTASVVARESLGLLRLDRATFLEAVTGMPASHAAAEDLMAARIAETTSARDHAT
jgi:MFS family permease